MPTGRPLKELTLSDDERLTLEQWARRPKSAQRLALRSRISINSPPHADKERASCFLSPVLPRAIRLFQPR